MTSIQTIGKNNYYERHSKPKSGVNINKCVDFKNLNNNEKSADISFGAFSLAGTAEHYAKQLAGTKLFTKTISGEKFNQFLKDGLENPGLYENIAGFGVTCTLRPLAIMITPGAKKEDKRYAAVQSISSGIMSLLFGYAIYKPIEKAIDEIIGDVNRKNVNTAVKDLYTNQPEVIKELSEHGILPDKLPEIGENESILGKFSKFWSENKVSNKLEKLKTSQSAKLTDKTELTPIEISIEKFNAAAETAFETIVKEKNKLDYLYHKSIKLVENGKLAPVIAKVAENSKNILSFSSKVLIAPLLAFTMIGAIPPLMKLIFPKHKKSIGGDAKKTNLEIVRENPAFSKTLRNEAASDPVFKQFIKVDSTKPQNIAFTGSASLFERFYLKPVSNVLKKAFKPVYENDAAIRLFTKTGEPIRDDAGKVLMNTKKNEPVTVYDKNFWIQKAAAITACWGSVLYILNTITNKKIEEERKPALCLNMGFVAVFSYAVGHYFDKISKKAVEVFSTKHAEEMGRKIAFNSEKAWKAAMSLTVFTLTFRFLGPVIAAPIADKMTKFMQNHGWLKKPQEKKPA